MVINRYTNVQATSTQVNIIRRETFYVYMFTQVNISVEMLTQVRISTKLEVPENVRHDHSDIIIWIVVLSMMRGCY